MLNALDLLVIVFMALAAVSLVAVVLMFALRHEKAKKVFFYITAAMGIYMSYVAVRIMRLAFPVQLVLGIVLGLMAVAAIVLQIKGKENPNLANIAPILAAVSLVAGMINAFS